MNDEITKVGKAAGYEKLVAKRKNCHDCEKLNWNFVNQSSLQCKGFDSNHIGNMSVWANNLEADVIIVGQDFSNEEIFIRDEGKIQKRTKLLTNESSINEYSTATNYFLRELTKELRLDIGLPSASSANKIFITNSVLCLKKGKMNERISRKVSDNCGSLFLKPLIELIQPKIIIMLGAVAARSVISIYSNEIKESEKIIKEPFSKIFAKEAFTVMNNQLLLFPVYHPGRLGQLRRSWENQKQDWRNIREKLDKLI